MGGGKGLLHGQKKLKPSSLPPGPTRWSRGGMRAVSCSELFHPVICSRRNRSPESGRDLSRATHLQSQKNIPTNREIDLSLSPMNGLAMPQYYPPLSPVSPTKSDTKEPAFSCVTGCRRVAIFNIWNCPETSNVHSDSARNSHSPLLTRIWSEVYLAPNLMILLPTVYFDIYSDTHLA